ncbi:MULTISPECIES: ribose-phosphate diphosphokinase [Holospora]|uniref:ribose-phosphate diphosphokinase n=2 Tax=Holospora TaxID=44747 RepID=A0A061JG91_9PROT|nr:MULTISPECIES: ribose-phosphate diphosphokinase [Holospora]ETZ04905.1 ribose-phosphate pyrophosphokinase [Holospora undulata HU1]GAJ46447.1 ribose-phosphate pyrophosphokinase [Holospora elegans E1]
MPKIIAGSSCKKIACDLSTTLNIGYMDVVIERFSDQELRVQLPSHLYEEDTIIVQSTCNPANDHLMELLFLIDAAKRAGSRRIISIVPYFGYSRQDRPAYKWGPISARLIAAMLEAAGIDHIVTLDLHSKQAEGFFKMGVQNIDPSVFFSSYLEKSPDLTVVSPDIGGLVRAQKMAEILNAELAIINKTRNGYNSCEMNTIIGEVSDKNCVIIDDIIDTGETICKAAFLLKQHKARSIRVIASHAVLSNHAKQKLTKAPIDLVLTTNSIPQELNQQFFKILNIVPILAETVKMLMRL